MSNISNSFILSSNPLSMKRLRAIEKLKNFSIQEDKSQKQAYITSRMRKQTKLCEDLSQLYACQREIFEECEQIQITAQNLSSKIGRNQGNQMAFTQTQPFFSLRKQSRNNHLKQVSQLPELVSTTQSVVNKDCIDYLMKSQLDTNLSRGTNSAQSKGFTSIRHTPKAPASQLNMQSQRIKIMEDDQYTKLDANTMTHFHTQPQTENKKKLDVQKKQQKNFSNNYQSSKNESMIMNEAIKRIKDRVNFSKQVVRSKRAISSNDLPLQKQMSTFQAEPFLSDDENLDIDLKRINNKQRYNKYKAIEKISCKQLPYHDDEDLNDFEHYVQFKKENNKGHFKKLNKLEKVQNNEFNEYPSKMQFKDNYEGDSSPNLDSNLNSPCRSVSCLSADSPSFRHRITDPAKASLMSHPLKHSYNWWEYNNQNIDSQSTTMTKNSKLGKKKGFKGNFKTSTGLIKLQPTQISLSRISHDTEKTLASSSKKSQQLYEKVTKKSSLLESKVNHINKVCNIDKVCSNFLDQPTQLRQQTQSKQGSHQRIKEEPVTSDKKSVIDDKDDYNYKEILEEDESIDDKSSYDYRYTDNSGNYDSLNS